MKPLRAVLGRLDPWAALLLGVLIALGVAILLATPGPWHKVVGPAPPVQPAAPADVAVFALGSARGTCTAVLWLHVDQSRPALTVVVLAAETQGFVPGAGLTPLRRIVDEVGPEAAATALGQALAVPMDAWITLDDQALHLVLAPRSRAGEARAPLLQYERAQGAWEGRGDARRIWATQYQSLGSALARLPFERINVVAFSNYVLGWGHIQSDLNLQGATSLATSLGELLPAQVDVCAAAAIVETCRRGEAWRVDRSAMEQLRQSLAFGLTPPPAGTIVTWRPRPARVLVVLPGARYRSDAVRERGAPAPAALGRRARRRAGRQGASLGRPRGAHDRRAESWRPLAVLVAPPPASVPRREPRRRPSPARPRRGRRRRLPAVLARRCARDDGYAGGRHRPLRHGRARRRHDPYRRLCRGRARRRAARPSSPPASRSRRWPVWAPRRRGAGARLGASTPD